MTEIANTEQSASHRRAEAFARLTKVELRELVDVLYGVSSRNEVLAALYEGARDNLSAREACGCARCSS